MPKNTKILMVITFVLAVTAWFSIRKGGAINTIEEEEAMFAIKDSGSVTRVVFKSPQNQALDLEQDMQNWRANKQFIADDEKLNSLLNFIYKVKIKRPVFKEVIPFVKSKIENEGIEISIFNRENALQKYIVWIDSSNSSEIVAQSAASPTLYVLDAGFESDKKDLFSSKVSDWRQTEIFKSKIRDIEKLEVTFTYSPSSNFLIENQQGKFNVKGMKNSDSLKILSYLDLYKSVRIKKYLLNEKLKDSLINGIPSFGIILKDKNNSKPNGIRIFFNEAQKGPVYGLVGDKNELVIIRTSLFEYLLQKRSFFEKKNVKL